jgi:hypothetical protein
LKTLENWKMSKMKNLTITCTVSNAHTQIKEADIEKETTAYKRKISFYLAMKKNYHSHEGVHRQGGRVSAEGARS